MGDQILNQIDGFTYQMGNVVVSAINDNQYLVQGLSLGSSNLSVTQNNNYSNGDAVYWTGLTWELAQTDAESTIADGFISDVTATSFTAILKTTTITAHGLGSAGQVLYVSQGTPGALTTTKPTTGIVQPVARVYDADTLIVHDWQAYKATISYNELTDLPTLVDPAGVVNTVVAGTGISVDDTDPNNPIVALSGAAPGTNPLIMTERTTDPSAPSSGFVNLYLKNLAGLPIIHSQDTSNIIRRFQRSIIDGQLYYAGPAQSTSLSYLGCQPSTSGTISHPTPTATTFGFTSNIVTTAVANNSIQIQHRANAYARNYGGWNFQAKIYFPDADYGSGATGFRFACGLTSDTNLTTESGSNNASTHRAIFHISTSLSETTFKFSTRDGSGTERRVDTAMTFAVNKLYHFFTTCLPGGSIIYWRIDNITDSTTFSGSVDGGTYAIPGATTFLRCGVAMNTLDAVARSFGHAISYCEAG